MKRAARLLGVSWLVFAHGTGLSVIALGSSWALLRATAAPELPVIEPYCPVGETCGVQNLTDQVPVGGMVQYTLDLRRNASCPGTVITTLMKVLTDRDRDAGRSAAVVTFSRPVVSTEIRPYPNIPGAFRLPDGVSPGRWKVRSAVDSKCPTYSRLDPYLDVEIEVTP